MQHYGKLPGVIEKVDYAVPMHYTIGERFDSMAEAVAAARRTIKASVYRGAAGRDGHPQDQPDGKRIFDVGADRVHFTRAFVHQRDRVRWADGGSSDRVVSSTEVFLGERERDALLLAAVTA